jgi:hypothetical protein
MFARALQLLCTIVILSTIVICGGGDAGSSATIAARQHVRQRTNGFFQRSTITSVRRS